MVSLHPELPSVPLPKGYWLLFGIGVVLAAEVAGVLSSIIAHPLMWTTFALLSPILDVGLPGSDLLHNIQSGIVYSLVGLLLVGWLTAIIGGIAGGLLIRLQHVLTQRSPSQQREKAKTVCKDKGDHS